MAAKLRMKEPGPRLKKALWFVALYAAGVILVASAAYGIRWMIL